MTYADLALLVSAMAFAMAIAVLNVATTDVPAVARWKRSRRIRS